jgi:hypothetical protein
MNRPLRLLPKIALGAFAVLLLVGGYFLYRIGPSNAWGMLLYDQREEGALRVGDVAPDVTLLALDGSTPVRLHEQTGRGKPSVLIFGSYT